MSKLGTIGAIALSVLEKVPEPHVAAAATAIESIIAIVHEEHMRALAAGEAVSLDALKAQVREAFAEAAEPWKRIKERAAANPKPLTADELGHPYGSTGD